MKKIILLAFAVMLATTPVLAGINIGSSIGFATLNLGLNDNITVILGANYISTAGVSMTGLLGKVNYNLAKAGEVQPNVGLYYTTNGAAAATTTIGLTWGVLTPLTSSLSIGADFVLASSTSAAGVSTTSILPAVAVAATYSL
ncbi:hypothetical protein A3H38_05360 [candidate division WOR-1 bacterium RIFCSPLOWO2_02_FULL_46_20]|uniref:DUF3494 domain-containing protein n=1 Tax=candidate division WOR-1 bacterium RIFCSPLOWO2_02_FULL_46_20 TaxID=1802567 RepID=A0A1F4R5Z0_UNCSA|nr:MAG: hypothetical protein A3H38_05360 [candidate division WOR-1 bacterium RIFCSPLOWO2_02_FULL_46_20]